MNVVLLKQRGVACNEMRWTINAIPQPSIPVQAHDLGPTYRLEGSVHRDVIAELGRPQPSLSIEGRGQALTLDAAALAALAEFGKVYTDIAKSAAVAPFPAPTQLTCERRSSPRPAPRLPHLDELAHEHPSLFALVDRSACDRPCAWRPDLIC